MINVAKNFRVFSIVLTIMASVRAQKTAAAITIRVAIVGGTRESGLNQASFGATNIESRVRCVQSQPTCNFADVLCCSCLCCPRLR